MSFQWVDDYASGNMALDEAKKTLFELSNKLEVTDDWIAQRQAVVLLFKQMKAVFEIEEEGMRQTNYPALDTHCQQHAHFLERLADRSTDVGKGHMNKKAILKVLADWAQGHVPVDDAALARVVEWQA